jgi:hypothetical protein
MSDSQANEHDDLEACLPPIVGRVQVTWTGEWFVFRFPDGQELVYTLEECDPIYRTLHEQRALLAGASFSIIPTPDGSMAFRLSGEGAVLLLAGLRDIRHELGIPDPPDNPRFSGFPERGESNGLLS